MDTKLVAKAFMYTLYKLQPQYQIRNPVICCCYMACCLLTILLIYNAILGTSSTFDFLLLLWLWLTVIFSYFSESLAEVRGKTQMEIFKNQQSQTMVKKIDRPDRHGSVAIVPIHHLHPGDWILLEAGDLIPITGEVRQGAALVNESAITGESAPVIREANGTKNQVLAGTQLLSDWLIIQVTTPPNDVLTDSLNYFMAGSHRQKTPVELSLSILLSMSTLVFLVVCLSLFFFANQHLDNLDSLALKRLPLFIALFVCLSPTTIGGLLSAIGLASMDRLLQHRLIAFSAHAIEAAGDVDVVIVDKTGTLTQGHRRAITYYTSEGISDEHFVQITYLASLADKTPEGISILQLMQKSGAKTIQPDSITDFLPFSAETRMSGVNIYDRQIRKGAVDAIEKHIRKKGGFLPLNLAPLIRSIAEKGGTPLLVADEQRVLGVLHLKDMLKPDVQRPLSQLRAMGIKTVMVTGDNPLTAASIASEAGVDDFLAEMTPSQKLHLIKDLQNAGHLVAMLGDGNNDAPALAQADVAIAMLSGTTIAKSASNLIDMDSNPRTISQLIHMGQQLLITRGTLTTFSMANDLAKYFAILPGLLATQYPVLNQLNIMQLHSPHTAILSAVTLNALTLILLIPLALRGKPNIKQSTDTLLKKNLLYYGVGGLILPFLGIKVIDTLIYTVEHYFRN